MTCCIRWLVNYSRFGAICELDLAQVVASETAVWWNCLRQKKVDLRTFRRQEKCFECVIIHEKLQMCAYCSIDNVPKQCAEFYTYNL